MQGKRLSYIENILKENGYRITEQRRKIIKLFLDNPNKHFHPTDIHAFLIEQGEAVGIATVYRNIKILLDNDIIEEVTFNSSKLYELKLFSRKSIHAHFICLKCKRVLDYIDVDTSLKLIKIINEIERRYDFKIEDSEITFTGFCKKCSIDE
ncbi:Fur family transcriptional regulator [Caloranaerobacter ferrireducens]|uniref:Fur family transcriptional regulator n=1 Tax=Caloranaerobacter ferrireducens TaxID=1323370 RepID=UPI00084DDAB1|nr:Fur family transcriptional regulator [Caloranaerobacter ferrireducens]